MQQRVEHKRKVALQHVGQLQSWLEHEYSSQAGVEALNADAILQGNYPWDIILGGSFRQLLWCQRHMTAGKLARCDEQLHPLRLQAANGLRLFSHQERLGSTGLQLQSAWPRTCAMDTPGRLQWWRVSDISCSRG